MDNSRYYILLAAMGVNLAVLIATAMSWNSRLSRVERRMRAKLNGAAAGFVGLRIKAGRASST